MRVVIKHRHAFSFAYSSVSYRHSMGINSLCSCRFMQFTVCDQPVQHSQWPEHANDLLP